VKDLQTDKLLQPVKGPLSHSFKTDSAVCDCFVACQAKGKNQAHAATLRLASCCDPSQIRLKP